jgi:hypothetical protein
MSREPTDCESREALAEGAAEMERQACMPQPSLAAEFFWFLLHNKKWWLVPILLAFLLIGLLVVLGGTPLAPFIYTVF